MATQHMLTHPGLDRLGRAYDAASIIFEGACAAVNGWQGWSRLAARFDAWGRSRVEALILQDPRMRAEILAAAQRMTSDDAR